MLDFLHLALSINMVQYTYIGTCIYTKIIMNWFIILEYQVNDAFCTQSPHLWRICCFSTYKRLLVYTKPSLNLSTVCAIIIIKHLIKNTKKYDRHFQSCFLHLGHCP